MYYLPANAFCIAITGRDAIKVVNNLNTNDIAKLDVGGSCESFVTNVRGWVVAHVVVSRLVEKVLLVGQHPSPEDICNHIERYIIREDASVALQPELSVAYVRDLPDKWLNTFTGQSQDEGTAANRILTLDETAFAGWFVAWPFSGCDGVLLISSIDSDQLSSNMAMAGMSAGTAEALDLLRIRNRWPLQASEITEKTIPQELDRDAVAISFTKGCYLGQETIARLDARGQLQKKLCLIEIESPEDSSQLVGAGCFVLEKEVGMLTSIAADRDRALGLAMLKRGAYDAGTRLTIKGIDSRQLNAKVIEPCATSQST